MICISLPLIAGIADRAAGTSAALTGPELMTENGLSHGAGERRVLGQGDTVCAQGHLLYR